MVRDRSGHVYQVEVQVVVHEALPERMLFTWARLYNRQFKRGQTYADLLPVTSIWILDRRLRGDGQVHRELCLRDRDGVPLTSHCNLHILELANLDVTAPNGSLENWLYFLKNARYWTELPAVLDRGVMREAMGVMKQFSEDDAQYYRYIAELDAETVELTRRQSMSRAVARLSAAERDLEEQSELLAGKDGPLADQGVQLADQGVQLAKQAKALADKDTELARLSALLQARANEGQ